MKRHILIVLACAALLISFSWLLRVEKPRPQIVAPEPAAIESVDPSPEMANTPPPEPTKPATNTPPKAVVPKTEAAAPAAIASFAQWTQMVVTNAANVSHAQGEALAWKRREAMLELIESDPERALALALPAAVRAQLPASIARHVETWIDSRGSLLVAMSQGPAGHKTRRWAVFGDQHFDAFVYGSRRDDPSRENIPLHGIILGTRMAVSAEPLRKVDSAEVTTREAAGRKTCRVCSREFQSPAAGVAADIGGELAWFCGEEHFSIANSGLKTASFGPSRSGPAEIAAGGGGTWTLGRKSLLYIRLNFPDDLTEPNSEAEANEAMKEVNRFFTANSYNQTWITTTVTPLLTLPQAKSWYATAGEFKLLLDARETARKAGFDTSNFDLDIVSHTDVPGFDWGGLGFVGGKGTWLQSTSAGVTAHELGHNYGLPHANFWETATNSSVIARGINDEYGNIFDTMGNATAGNNHFNALFKHSLDWLPAAGIHDIISNGVYRIHPFDAPQRQNGKVYAAKVRKDFERYYWLEFRQLFANNVSLQNGVLLNWSPWSQSEGGTDLLDTTAETWELADAGVVVGRTFSDFVSEVHITPVRRSPVKTDPWIDVQVNAGPFAGNLSPMMKIEIDPTNAAPGQLVHFHATATDANNDTLAYLWSFDDGTFSTNNEAWIARSWSEPGEHVVRCVVSDMKGGSASANAIVTIGQPTGFRISGWVMNGNDDPVEGVRVDNGILAAEEYVFSYTDSDGYFVLTGLDGDVNLEATKYGHTFTNLNWQSPLSLSSNTQVSFFAIAEPTVFLRLSTNTVRESTGPAGQFTITRTGSTNEDLALTLFVDGEANVPGDLSFTPTLGTGSNPVVIPAGTNQVVFSFSPVNDNNVEWTETTFVTLAEDLSENPAYVIAPLAEARISILDDDSAAQPSVSIAATHGHVAESGMDSVSFLVTRTGPPTGNLTVFYSATGTATAGTDYPMPVNVVVIPAGASSARIDLKPNDDKDVEADETVVLTIAPNAAYQMGNNSDSATIVDDDLLVVSVSTTSDSAAEPGHSGRFTIKRDGDLSANLVVYYSLSGSATGDIDYIAPTGALTIPAGAASADVSITGLDDLLLEGDETVKLTIVGATGYDVGNPSEATLTIRDNEKATLSFTTSTAQASEPGETTGTITLSRGPVTSGSLAVNLAISGTAIPGADYVPLETTVVIPNGSSTVMLEIIPFDDLHLEYPEDVIVTIVPSTNYVLGAERARVVIQDNDDNAVPAVGFTFAASAFPEDESPGASVSLSHTSAMPVTVNFRVLGGNASNADYTLGTAPLTIEVGERSVPLPLTITDDLLAEEAETIRLVLVDPENATHDGYRLHTYTILDNDLSAISVSGTASVSETGAPGNFRVSRTGSTASNQVVNFQVTGTASAPSDFPSLGNRVIIPAGATFVDLPVVAVNDNTVELDEEIVLTLTSAPGSRIASPAKATMLIADDETNGPPVVSISSTNKPSALEGGANGEFVISRTGPTASPLLVLFSVMGTAGNGADYTFLTNGVTIPAGTTSAIVSVTAADDTSVEGDETVIIAITVASNSVYRASHSATATVILHDNDQSIRLDASDFESAEPGDDLGAFTFTRFGTTNAPVQVFFTISGSAANGIDYNTISNSVIIPAGSWTTTLPIVPKDDFLVEGTERVTLALQANSAYVLSSPASGTVMILEDEPQFSIVALNKYVVEGSGEPATFRVIRTGDPYRDATARVSIGGTALFTSVQTNLLFTCGVVGVDLHISPTNELTIEGEETVTGTLVPDPSYTIISPSNALIRIGDAGEFRAPRVTITSPTASPVFLPGTNVNIILEASVTDDGDSNTPLTLLWTNPSGPAPVAFTNIDQLNTTASFTNSGVYVLRLYADENGLTNYAEVTVLVDALGMLSSNLLHWTFDQNSGTNVNDISGNENHGVVVGPANWTANGAIDGALRLTGTNNFVRESTASGLLNGLKQFSLALWIKSEETNFDHGLFAADSSALPTVGLVAHAGAACGITSNAFEASIASTRGAVRRYSASNRFTNGWQQLTLTWSNGLAPTLFINGKLDQPGKTMVPLRGTITNSAEFLIGKGPANVLRDWQGLVDDVRLFPKLFSATEAAVFTATNFGPLVLVPTNITVQVITPIELPATVTDDGRPNPPGALSIHWEQLAGPMEILLPNPNTLTNLVEFTLSGDYVFRIVADDGQVKVYQDLPVIVVEPTQVSVFASDPEATELESTPGEFTFQRQGDLNFDLTMNVAMTGTASNGIDFVYLAQSNTVTLPSGVETLTMTITPFLDHRTEGDETITFTIITNVAYTVASAEASVTIKDSPYGEWNIARFTLEELTDPLLSGEGVDYDSDGRGNFVEYAFNQEPKSVESNSPLTTTLELNPATSRQHITLTYQRRLDPTDVAYEVRISPDLLNWNSGTNHVEQLEVVDDGNGLTETVKARVVAPWPTGNRQFVTIRVWLRSNGP